MKLLFAPSQENAQGIENKELWSLTALHLAGRHQVSCSVSPLQADHSKVEKLRSAGVEINVRTPPHPPLWNHFAPERLKAPCQTAFVKTLQRVRPALVVISQSGNTDIEPYASDCRKAGVPYCSIVQAVPEIRHVPSDMEITVLRRAYAGAQKVFFVSDRNREVLEKQMAFRMANADRCFNPVNLPYKKCLPFPESLDCVLACVARTDFHDKGQDMVLQIMDMKKWRERPVRLNFFGAGGNRQILQELIRYFGLQSVAYRGFCKNPVEIWETHQALVLPSRQEGLPLALVEAAWCGRPAIVTDIAGNGEVVIEGKTGFLAAAPSVEDFDAALERAWAAREAWSQMGLAAHQHCRDYFPENPVADLAAKLEQICQAL